MVSFHVFRYPISLALPFCEKNELIEFRKALYLACKKTTLYTAVTENIYVKVTTSFEPQYSQPEAQRFFHSYHVVISNKSELPVKLLRRHWYIFDSNGESRVVEGAGVVGVTPVIPPGEEYSYSSACDLESELGMMQGFYTMQQQVPNANGSFLHVEIPQFKLEAPWKLN